VVSPVLTKPFCEYNCDYPCTVCITNARRASAALTEATKEEDADMRGYMGARDELPIMRFTDEGYPMGPVSQTTMHSYSPPPFKELVLRRIVEPPEIDIEGPSKLKHRHIVTL